MLFQDAKIVCRSFSVQDNPDIFIGTKDRPGLEDGKLSLNHKSKDCPYTSTTEYIADQSQETIQNWKAELGLGNPDGKPFAGLTIEVEDASVDTCMAALALYLRLKNKEVSEEWVEYSRLWEAGYTDETGAPENSFGTLHSALVHVDLQTGSDANGTSRPAAFSKALCSGTAYLEGLMALGISPFEVPKTLNNANMALRRLHNQARSRLAYEKLTYRRLSDSAIQLQLAVHLSGCNRKALVDAIFFREALLTGALKNFSRSDTNTFTGQGFAFQALFRPSLKGTGNDITVSTNPSANLDLSRLWLELEKREDNKWLEFARTSEGFARPRGGGKDRHLHSFDSFQSETKPSHQPWWDDNGNQTFVAAPRMIEHLGNEYPASLLTWSEVKKAIWHCYAPTMGLRLRARGTNGPEVKISDNDFDPNILRSRLLYGTDLFIVDAERIGGSIDDTPILNPTLTSTLATFTEKGTTGIDNLIPSSEFDLIEDQAGIAVIVENGIAIVQLSNQTDFPVDDLRRASSEVALTVQCALNMEEKIRTEIRDLVKASVLKGTAKAKRKALTAIYSTKLEAREAWDHAIKIESNHLTKEVRTACENRWNAKVKFENALTEISELESMVVSSSEVKANTILNRLAIYGLPASLAADAVSGIFKFNDSNGGLLGFSLNFTLLYLLFIGLGIVALLLASSKENSKWKF